MESKQSQHKIFCDLDGVLVDLKGTVSRLANQNIDIDSQSSFMRAMVLLRRKGMLGNSEQFWADLPWTTDGKELWSYLKPHNPVILTGALNSDSGAGPGKIAWCKKNLGISQNEVIATQANLKQKYASPGAILIDDTAFPNIAQWNASGGIGILHHNTIETIKEIEYILSK